MLLFLSERPESLGDDWFHIGHLVDRRGTYELLRYECEYGFCSVACVVFGVI